MAENNDELLEYLKTDTIRLKFQNELLQRRSNMWAILACCLTAVLFASICAFSISVFLLTQEHTKQLQAAFKVEFEASETRERIAIQQDAASDNASVVHQTGAGIGNNNIGVGR